MKERVPTSQGCFVCGKDNPIGMKLETYRDGDRMTADFVPGANYTGWKNIVHGGIITTLLDEIMVWVPWAKTGKYFFTGEIKVRFMKPLLAGTEVTINAWCEKEGRRIIETAGEIIDTKGTVYARATGKYISMTEAQQKEFEKSLINE